MGELTAQPETRPSTEQIIHRGIAMLEPFTRQIGQNGEHETLETMHERFPTYPPIPSYLDDHRCAHNMASSEFAIQMHRILQQMRDMDPTQQSLTIDANTPDARGWTHNAKGQITIEKVAPDKIMAKFIPSDQTGQIDMTQIQPQITVDKTGIHVSPVQLGRRISVGWTYFSYGVSFELPSETLNQATVRTHVVEQFADGTANEELATDREFKINHNPISEKNEYSVSQPTNNPLIEQRNYKPTLSDTIQTALNIISLPDYVSKLKDAFWEEYIKNDRIQTSDFISEHNSIHDSSTIYFIKELDDLLNYLRYHRPQISTPQTRTIFGRQCTIVLNQKGEIIIEDPDKPTSSFIVSKNGIHADNFPMSPTPDATVYEESVTFDMKTNLGKAQLDIVTKVRKSPDEHTHKKTRIQYDPKNPINGKGLRTYHAGPCQIESSSAPIVQQILDKLRNRRGIFQ